MDHLLCIGLAPGGGDVTGVKSGSGEHGDTVCVDRPRFPAVCVMLVVANVMIFFCLSVKLEM